jgi:hypothetical protein
MVWFNRSEEPIVRLSDPDSLPSSRHSDLQEREEKLINGKE